MKCNMEIIGNIESIIYRNEENNYTILSVKTKEGHQTLIGELHDATIGQKITAEVKEVENPVYGTQYKILDYELSLPDDEDVIAEYLSGSDFKGIGIALAKKIVDQFGQDTFDVILNSPEKLFLVKGMTKKRIDTLVDGVSLRESELSTILFLKQYDFNNRQIKKIMENYDTNIEDIIKNNPYDLAMKISGIGFLTCDKIAMKNGIKADSDDRISSAILYILQEMTQAGNTFIYFEQLSEKLQDLLEYDFADRLEDILVSLQIDRFIKIVVSNNKQRIYLLNSYNIEKNLSQILYNMKDNINIITGGPGTGKTYNINKTINENIAHDYKIILCAPTGRAAKRMMEVTRFEAKTIHRTLEFGKDFTKENSSFGFLKNETNKLDCDVLIVDEMSMVDEYLMYNLMKAVKDTTKIVLVGDVDQLPSVGGGNVLKDMIDSKLFNVTFLTKIYRQGKESSIVKNAHLVNEGEMIDLSVEKDDFHFVKRIEEEKIKQDICTLVSKNIPKHFNISNDQIQVLTTTKKGNLSVGILNNILQEHVNKKSIDKPELTRLNKTFRLYDKVMQTANRYDLAWNVYDENGIMIDQGVGVFNGDIGSIIGVDEEKGLLKVQFEDRIVEYDNEAMKDLDLAYAITVHKSQGSEYDVVVMPMVNSSRFLLNRKILYTAMTRAKKAIIFVGSEKIFEMMVKNEYEEKRNSALCDELYIS